MRNGKIRQKRVEFAQVSNKALQDPELTLAAKGLYSLIQSYITIPNFTLYKNTLKKCCVEGNHSFEGKWKELKDAGYLVQHKIRDRDTGKYFYEYDLLDNRDHKNTEALENDESIHPPKNHPLENPGLDNPPSGEVRGFNKTYSKDTNFNYINQSVSLENSGKSYPQVQKENTKIDGQTDVYTSNGFDDKESSKEKDKISSEDNCCENENLKTLLTKVEADAFIEVQQNQEDKDRAGELVEILKDMYLSDKTRISGNFLPQDTIRKSLDKLTYWDLEAVFAKFSEAAAENKIKNVKGYLQTMLYNCQYETSNRNYAAVRAALGSSSGGQRSGSEKYKRNKFHVNSKIRTWDKYTEEELEELAESKL